MIMIRLIHHMNLGRNRTILGTTQQGTGPGRRERLFQNATNQKLITPVQKSVVIGIQEHPKTPLTARFLMQNEARMAAIKLK